MHQIRIHLKFIGFPIYNDPIYNKQWEAVHAKEEGQLLHANYLQFFHPITNNKLTFYCPVPSFFHRTLKLLIN
jgi:23S rRNA pseudouridine1911/1915/1917 synthase